MTATLTLLLAAVSLGLLAIAMGWVLGWASQKFHVFVDPRVSQINDVLPAANCGGCGYVGCNDYAEAVVRGEAAPNLCAPGGKACAEKVAGVMGVELKESWPFKAVIHCSATRDQRLKQMPYFGEKTCAAANLVTGIQGCTYGCLGMGDCVVACPYDAIYTHEGLARVDYDKCTGCRACEKVCPRNIITIVPFKAEKILVVGCSNKDQGPVVKEVCAVGCIGCKACVRPSAGLIEMGEDNLPRIDYDQYTAETDLHPSIEKCRMESLIFVGTPTEEERAEVRRIRLPKRVEADFATTVDETEWWG